MSNAITELNRAVAEYTVLAQRLDIIEDDAELETQLEEAAAELDRLFGGPQEEAWTTLYDHKWRIVGVEVTDCSDGRVVRVRFYAGKA